MKRSASEPGLTQLNHLFQLLRLFTYTATPSMDKCIMLMNQNANIDIMMNLPIPLPFAAKVEDFLKQDRLLSPHCRYYVREMRIQGYTQLLESYRSLTVQYMANAFGVSEEFIDK